MMFKPSYIYPMKGERGRYRFVLTEPTVEVPNQYWLLDCWIVDEEGNKKPGVDCVPVPVNRGNVYISKGKPCSIVHERQRGGWFA